MDFGGKIEALQEQANSLAQAYAEAEDFTRKFLDCCKNHGIKTVAIQEENKAVKSSVGFGFGANGSVFADERENGWPAIWGVCADMKISGGCGNGGQHQINYSAQAKLVDGTYTLKNGTWKKIS
jgi:hypothetical protein